MSNHPFFTNLFQNRKPFDIEIIECNFADVRNWNYTDSVYPCWLFYWDPVPGAALILNGKKIPLKEDHVVLIPPYTKFSTENIRDFQQFYVHFTAPAPYDRTKRNIFLFSAEAVKSFFTRHESCSESGRIPVMIRAMIYQYLSEIPEKDFLDPEENQLSPGIRKALDAINSKIDSSLSNQELCKKAGMSRNQFYETFRKELGMTPGRYLLNVRMEFARRKLIYSSESIEEVAAAAGYADRFHFSKAFKKFFHTPPGNYRKPGKKK